MKRKNELIGIVILLIITLFLLNKKFGDEYKLKKEGVYVIGHLKKSSFGNETGWMYEYVYMYRHKSYMRNFSGPVSPKIISDSLMFFKILPQNPMICRQLQDILVPSCITLEDVPLEGWAELPLKYCDDK